MPQARRVTKQIAIHYRHEGYRVLAWRSDWFGDQFEVFPAAEWPEAKALLDRLCIPTQEMEGD